MVNRIKGFWVSLESDIREDDFEAIKNAVLMIKGVLDVNSSITYGEDWMNRSKVAHELKKEILEILKEK
jgi:hypothetical protein